MSGSQRTGPQPPLRPVLPHLSARPGLILSSCAQDGQEPSVGWGFPGLWTALFLLLIYLFIWFVSFVCGLIPTWGLLKCYCWGGSRVKGSRERSPRIPQALTQGSWAVLLTLRWNSKLRPPKRWISLSWMADTGIHPCPSSLGRS